jgi:Methyltransferase domain
MQLLGYNKKKLALFNRQEKIILNIGCANDVKNGYINGDLFPALGDIFRIVTGQYQIKHGLFINLCNFDKNLSEIADGIILSHVLEHIPSWKVITALKNCCQYLKSGASIRVSVPYLGKYDEKTINSDFEKASNMLKKNTLIYCHGHQFMYNVELIQFLMHEAGFSKVQEVNFQEGFLGESDIPERQAESIYVTGFKPE